nr:ABC transporter ATP-binding protein [uncultured Treponema sp.]
MKNAVLVKCRSFRYFPEGEEVLKKFDFNLEYGKVTLLSGVSGSGKSTLLSLINGIIPRVIPGLFDGEILIDGEDIKSKSMSQISRKVGSVLQNAESQIINQTVEDEIAFGCENFGFEPSLIATQIDKSCLLMQIQKEWKTRTLSGGQKQRLVTASTLAMNGDILIFDEPLANLDGEGALILLELLKGLALNGKAVLLVEHRLDVALPYADIVWNLKDGRVEKVRNKNEFLKSQSDVIQSGGKPEVTVPRDTALLLTGIKKKFGSREILRGIDLEIKKGERILLTGENGCGKSTLMSIIARLLKADEGKISQYLNLDLNRRAGKKWFKTCGVVFQNPNYQLFAGSVRDEILFGAENKDYALCLADWFELTPLLDRHPHSLSEGQKRRLTVCSILAQKPKLLLLDEPTVGQDYHNLRNMIEIINHVHKEQQNTMITITHDIRCKKALCDREIKIEGGIIEKS